MFLPELISGATKGLLPHLIKTHTEGAEWLYPVKRLRGLTRSASPRLIVGYHGDRACDYVDTVPQLWRLSYS